MLNSFILCNSQNPFISAWGDSDYVGRCIFIGLIGLSLLSWTIIVHKLWIMSCVRQESSLFKRLFFEKKQAPLTYTWSRVTHPETPNAFFLIYDVIRSKTQELLKRNTKGDQAQLHQADIVFLQTYADSTTTTITKYLEKNLYLLSTIVTLSPFLGLLGTVYGILLTFSGLAAEGSLGSNQQILGGLSLALTTTVIGLLNAIPALIGHNYLRNQTAEFDHEMEKFSNEVLSLISMTYRTTEGS